MCQFKFRYVGVICVDLDMNAIKANESAFILSLTAILVGITIIICIITLIIIDLAVIKPLNKLSDIAVGYISNNEDRKKFADWALIIFSCQVDLMIRGYKICERIQEKLILSLLQSLY